MSSATEFLFRPVNAYAECWQRDHERIERWDLEERIKVGLALYDCIHGADERWSDAVRVGAAAVNDAESKSLLALYGRWLEPAARVLAFMKELESQGFSVLGSREFRDAWHRARSATLLDAAALQASIDELDAGKGRPLQEVADEIRRRHAGKGKES
jgi:hypothetical protein